MDGQETIPKASPGRVRRSELEIQEWFVQYVASLLECDPESVETGVPFERYGVDSSAVVGMTGDLEEWLGIEIDPTLPYDYPTIESLSKHLATEIDGQ